MANLHLKNGMNYTSELTMQCASARKSKPQKNVKIYSNRLDEITIVIAQAIGLF